MISARLRGVLQNSSRPFSSGAVAGTRFSSSAVLLLLQLILIQRGDRQPIHGAHVVAVFFAERLVAVDLVLGHPLVGVAHANIVSYSTPCGRAPLKSEISTSKVMPFGISAGRRKSVKYHGR